ncbi:phospholipase B1, membrane-associated-like [Clinocottus analis]|uniref:phospholipase B1, membrane-associated-like n=1 Tax=Clinocottus analis TaxID=304258 RepID=UPI0035C219C0
MSPSPSVPTSVENVRAADVKVIAALGDSLTTAIGANGSTILSIPIEFRQVSWRNVSDQIRHMIDVFKSYPGLNFLYFRGLDFEEDWKVVTMLIGMNDICDYCKDKTLFSPDGFVQHLTGALDLMMEIPRTIVNAVQIFPMKPLRDVQRPTLGCQLQKSFCSCLVQPAEDSPELQELVEVNAEFQRRLEQLLQDQRYVRDDFAVVLQPYLEKAGPPRLPDGSMDLSFFTADCFHFRVKGHEELAKGLWNNMFQPLGQKVKIETFSEPVELICPPKEHPYIYTRRRVESCAPARWRPSAALMVLLSLVTRL